MPKFKKGDFIKRKNSNVSTHVFKIIDVIENTYILKSKTGAEGQLLNKNIDRTFCLSIKSILSNL